MSNAASTCLEGFWWERIISPYTRYCTEYFIPKNNQANLIERRFYNEDGTVASQHADGGWPRNLSFPDRYLVGRQELIRYFMQTLQLTKQDLVILDRETNIGQPIFEEAQKPAWVWSSMQSTSVPIMLTISISCGTTTTSTNLPMLTRWTSLLFATDRQKEILAERFAKYTNHQPAIYTIPVGESCKLCHKTKIAPHFLWLLPLVWRQKSILTG